MAHQLDRAHRLGDRGLLWVRGRRHHRGASPARNARPCSRAVPIEDSTSERSRSIGRADGAARGAPRAHHSPLVTHHSPLTTHHSPLTQARRGTMPPSHALNAEEQKRWTMDWIVDVVIVLILLGTTASGLRSGFAATLGALLGLAAGIGAAVWAIPHITDAVDPDWRTLAAVGSLLALLLIGSGIGGRIGHMVRRGADRLHLGIIDRLLGGALGLVIGAAVVYLAGSVLTGSGIPALSSAVDSSRALQIVVETTPAALDGVLERLR
ncbi:CvpA family protein [Brachybacterium sp. JB7]|nr:CvpA family protein [Brachybacterium sp. JB7]